MDPADQAQATTHAGGDVTPAKRRRNPNGTGTIRYDPKRDRYDVRVRINGVRRKVTGTSEAEAWRRAEALKSEAHITRDAGIPKQPTVGWWLDHWRATILPGTIKPTTMASYSNAIDRYVKPEVGRIKLADLTPSDVRQMLANLERKRGQRIALSANSRRIALAVLSRSLKIAEREGLVTRNVAKLVDGPKLDRKRGRSLTPDQARQVMTAIEADDPMTRALITLLLSSGMRKGEALGLRWSDIDLEAATVHVRRMLSRGPTIAGSKNTLYLAESTKTAGSDRIVELSPPAIEALKGWRLVQKKQRLACAPAMIEGLTWGLGFPSDLVFTGPRGQALDPSRPNELLAKITEGLGLGRFTPHELRHSAASLMLGADVPLPVVSRYLGHSGIGVTMNVYGHLVSGELKAASAALAGVLTSDRTIGGADS